jgi:Protein of unknown function (DUF1402)
VRLSDLGLARGPNLLVPVRRLRRSGLHPTVPRPTSGWERQRLAALRLVSGKRSHVLRVAERYAVAPEAIVAAIMWDPLENPYRCSFVRLGPGRVRPVHMFGTRSEAEKVEAEGLVDGRSRSATRRLALLRDPDLAIQYIGAIMRRHADNYLTIAGVDIGDDPAVLCTLYQGGHSEARAKRLLARRSEAPDAAPIPADEMGPWAGHHLRFLRGLLAGQVISARELEDDGVAA